MKILKFSLLLVHLFLIACANPVKDNFQPYQNRVDLDAKKKIVIFFDGTANDFDSETNVSRLYHMIKNQDDSNISTLYVEGVGTGGRALGMLFGYGIGADVKSAYSFLSEHYNKGDDIYLVGFSRGAYAARILAGLVYVAGIVDSENISDEHRRYLVNELYTAYKGGVGTKNAVRDTKVGIVEILDSVRQSTGVQFSVELEARIKAMALWDTVEALGLPNYKEDIGYVNERYADQICNVDKVFHAVSLDDNRARMYTPILMTYRGINRLCTKVDVNEVVEEVWFNGAHADVGGGYKVNGLAGVSLNWMIERLISRQFPLTERTVYENKFDVIHNAENANLLYRWMFADIKRKPQDYREMSSYSQQHLFLHRSVIERLTKQKTEVQRMKDLRELRNSSLNTLASSWYKNEAFQSCFKETDQGFELKKDCHKILEAP